MTDHMIDQVMYLLYYYYFLFVRVCEIKTIFFAFFFVFDCTKKLTVSHVLQ